MKSAGRALQPGISPSADAALPTQATPWPSSDRNQFANIFAFSRFGAFAAMPIECSLPKAGLVTSTTPLGAPCAKSPSAWLAMAEKETSAAPEARKTVGEGKEG